jgi:hypothetical protein
MRSCTDSSARRVLRGKSRDMQPECGSANEARTLTLRRSRRHFNAQLAGHLIQSRSPFEQGIPTRQRHILQDEAGHRRLGLIDETSSYDFHSAPRTKPVFWRMFARWPCSSTFVMGLRAFLLVFLSSSARHP